VPRRPPGSRACTAQNAARGPKAGFRNWLKANAAHARAFEQTTEAWEAMGGVPAERLSSMVRWERVGSQRAWLGRRTLVVAASVALAVVGATYYLRTAPLTTAVGEQRAVTLQDGTRVYLNTASRLRVRYDEASACCRARNGRGVIRRRQARELPFSVMAGDCEITALGTSFVVRRDRGRLAVTLVEGKVAVAACEKAERYGKHRFSGNQNAHAGTTPDLHSRQLTKRG